MKRVEFQSFIEGDKESIFKAHQLHTVYLGPGKSYKFSSQRAAKVTLAAANEFFTQKLHEMNFYLVEMYCLYRRAWYYSDSKKETQKGRVARDVKEIKQALMQIEDYLDKIPALSRMNHGSSFTLNHFNLIHKKAIEAVVIFEILFREKTQSDALFTLRHLKNVFDEWIEKIQDYSPIESSPEL